MLTPTSCLSSSPLTLRKCTRNGSCCSHCSWCLDHLCPRTCVTILRHPRGPSSPGAPREPPSHPCPGLSPVPRTAARWIPSPGSRRVGAAGSCGCCTQWGYLGAGLQPIQPLFPLKGRCLVPRAVHHPGAPLWKPEGSHVSHTFLFLPLLSFCSSLGLLFFPISSFFHLLSASLPLPFSPRPFLALSSGPFQSMKRKFSPDDQLYV